MLIELYNSSRFQSSVKNIKRNYKITNKFSVKPVSEDLVKDIVNDLSSNKVADGEHPTENLERM